jgi:hypothetical protein
MSARVTQFILKFWERLHETLDIHLSFNSAYYPQTDRQTKRVNHILEDMLRACALPYGRSWDKSLPLVEFSYSNIYLESWRWNCLRCYTVIGTKPHCFGSDILQGAESQVSMAREYLRIVQSRHKSYADHKRREFIFEVEGFEYLKVSLMRGLWCFEVWGKLAPRYIGLFKITGEREEELKA